MRTSRGPVAWIAAVLERLGVCGNAGVAVGVMAGFMLTIVDVIEGPLALTGAEAVRIWLLLAAFGGLALLFIFTVFARWTASSVALPALVTSALVTALIVLAVLMTGLYLLAWMIGILAGMLVGSILCMLYKRVGSA